MNKPEVTQRGAFDMQVCVPFNWSDEQIVAFAERENPCGTTGGWQIRRGGRSVPLLQRLVHDGRRSDQGE